MIQTWRVCVNSDDGFPAAKERADCGGGCHIANAGSSPASHRSINGSLRSTCSSDGSQRRTGPSTANLQSYLDKSFYVLFLDPRWGALFWVKSVGVYHFMCIKGIRTEASRGTGFYKAEGEGSHESKGDQACWGVNAATGNFFDEGACRIGGKTPAICLESFSVFVCFTPFWSFLKGRCMKACRKSIVSDTFSSAIAAFGAKWGLEKAQKSKQDTEWRRAHWANRLQKNVERLDKMKSKVEQAELKATSMQKEAENLTRKLQEVPCRTLGGWRVLVLIGLDVFRLLCRLVQVLLALFSSLQGYWCTQSGRSRSCSCWWLSCSCPESSLHCYHCFPCHAAFRFMRLWICCSPLNMWRSLISTELVNDARCLKIGSVCMFCGPSRRTHQCWNTLQLI